MRTLFVTIKDRLFGTKEPWDTETALQKHLQELETTKRQAQLLAILVLTALIAFGDKIHL
jgi:hypothetical protein